MKAKNREINDLQLRIHQLKQLIDKGQSNGLGNDPIETLKSMTMAVIDPESVGGFRYPDAFSEGTSVFKAKGTFFLPINPSTNTVARWPAGSFYCECRPELDDTILYLDQMDALLEAFWVTADMDPILTDTYYGLYQGRSRQKNLGTTTLSADAYDIVLNFTGPSGELQDALYLEEGEVPNPGFYYNPMIAVRNGTDAISYARASVTIGDNGGTIDVDVTLSQIGTDGTILASNTVNTVTAANVTVDLPLATTPFELGSWKLVYSVVSNAGSNSTSWKVNWVTGHYWADGIVMRRHPLPKLNTIRTDFEKYRVTAQSLLVTYEGSTLTNAGFISSFLYRGGHPASLTGTRDYSSIAEYPLSYDGPLVDGTYGYWEPMDWLDMSFRCPMVSDTTRRYPYLITAGLYNGDASSGVIDQTNILRCKVILQIEFTSSAQTYDIKPSPVCPNILADVAIITSGVPNVMENGKHLAKLKSIASKAGKVAKALGSFAWENRAQIMRLAEAAAPIIATF